MSVRGDAQRAMIGAVVDAFGDRADDLVFIGGCVLSLYRGPSKAALRPTTDVDCLSGTQPWSRQEAMLAELCQRRRLAPDPTMQFRYRIEGTGFDVDRDATVSPRHEARGLRRPWPRRALEQGRRRCRGVGRRGADARRRSRGGGHCPRDRRFLDGSLREVPTDLRGRARPRRCALAPGGPSAKGCCDRKRSSDLRPVERACRLRC